MITIRELCSEKTDYSTTRWAFCITIIFDMIVISLSLVVSLVFVLIGKQLDYSFFSAIATLLGILTSLTAVPKVMQGFENKTSSNNLIIDEEGK